VDFLNGFILTSAVIGSYVLPARYPGFSETIRF